MAVAFRTLCVGVLLHNLRHWLARVDMIRALPTPPNPFLISAFLVYLVVFTWTSELPKIMAFVAKIKGIWAIE